MDVSTVTVLGNVVAEPRISLGVAEVDRASFRVIANQRRFDQRANAWVDAGEYGVNVVCWRALARGVAGSVHVGDPVLVVGRITERRYELDGEQRSTTEVTASYVGHDLSKGRAQFKRFPRHPAGGLNGGEAGIDEATDRVDGTPVDGQNAADGAAFLAENGKKPNVKTTATGLQYEVITEGKGARPKATDTVRVNYKVSLLDGTVFDDSSQHGGPADIPLSAVVPGWREGIGLMPVGSKYRFWIPAALGYGEQGTPGGPIPPNATLVFDVELLGVDKGGKPPMPQAR